MPWNSSRAIQNPKRWCQQGVTFHVSPNLEDPAVVTGLEKSILVPIPKNSSTEEFANHQTIALISHASKVMLKILHARLHITWTKKFQMSKLGLEKEEEPEIKLPTFAES